MIRAWAPVAAGLAGALLGGWLAGGLLGLGLVLICESGLSVAWGLLRDDGRRERVPLDGEHTLADVLEYQSRLP